MPTAGSSRACARRSTDGRAPRCLRFRQRGRNDLAFPLVRVLRLVSRSNQGATRTAKRARPVLSFAWNNAMRLLHPVAPFISEEVWLALPHDGPTIVTATWPDPLGRFPPSPAMREAFEALDRAAVERVRNLRAELGLHPQGARRRWTFRRTFRRRPRAVRALRRRDASSAARPRGESVDEALAP